MCFVVQNMYFISLHTGKLWDADSFSFCWLICCHSSDAECVIDSSIQTSDVIGSVRSFCCICIIFLISPLEFKERSISSWFNPSQKHRWGCDLDTLRFLITSGSVYRRKEQFTNVFSFLFLFSFLSQQSGHKWKINTYRGKCELVGQMN